MERLIHDQSTRVADLDHRYPRENRKPCTRYVWYTGTKFTGLVLESIETKGYPIAAKYTGTLLDIAGSYSKISITDSSFLVAAHWRD